MQNKDEIASKSYMHSKHRYEYVVGDGSNSIDIIVGRLLIALGFKSKLIGTAYLKEAILLRYSKPNTCRIGLISDIYPTVANKLDSTVNRVERAIRNTINDCYTNGELLRFNDLIQCQVISPVYAPTNGELLSSVVNWLQIEHQQQRVK